VPSECTRERKRDIFVEARNPDPILHPFERAREMTRALNATKLERLFAKPFVGALSGHIEGVYCLGRATDSLTRVISGSADGDVRVWDVRHPHKASLWKNPASHAAFVRGVCFVPGSEGNRFLSCGDDQRVKLWDIANQGEEKTCWQGRDSFTGIDHHWGHGLFATSSAGATVDIWNFERAEPVQSWKWTGSADTLSTVRFNAVEQHILATAATDRSVILYDLRMQGPLTKVVLQMRTNSIAWNPMEAYYFASANEDHRAYIFDMRRLDKAVNVLKDHVGAVMDVDFAPTGQEIVTAGYDRTLRIYKTHSGHSRDVYHTNRMQRLFSCKFSMDSQYILSGSDDGNVRIWKAQASLKSGILSEREKAARNYADQLKERYADIPEIKRISSHRHVPKLIKNMSRGERIERDAVARKDSNRRKNAKPGSLPDPKTLREEAALAIRK
jgi:DDB1- and CUL4-associated factor 13